MDLNLYNKYALVTGGSRGIGKEIALLLAQEGCNVAICARNYDGVKDVVSLIEDYGVKSIGVECDVLNKEDIERTFATVIKEWGSLHILINNIGGGGRWGEDNILDTSEDVWIDVYNKNTFAAMRFTIRFLPYMVKEKWGRVVTISSISGLQVHRRPWFGIAKSSEIVLMKSFARREEFIRFGITFNTVAPGAIMIPNTGWYDEMMKDKDKFDEEIKRDYPLGRLGSPEEVASVVAFICSEKSSLLNGSCIVVDGGESKII